MTDNDDPPVQPSTDPAAVRSRIPRPRHPALAYRLHGAATPALMDAAASVAREKALDERECVLAKRAKDLEQKERNLRQLEQDLRKRHRPSPTTRAVPQPKRLITNRAQAVALLNQPPKVPPAATRQTRAPLANGAAGKTPQTLKKLPAASAPLREPSAVP